MKESLFNKLKESFSGNKKQDNQTHVVYDNREGSPAEYDPFTGDPEIRASYPKIPAPVGAVLREWIGGRVVQTKEGPALWIDSDTEVFKVGDMEFGIGMPKKKIIPEN